MVDLYGLLLIVLAAAWLGWQIVKRSSSRPSGSFVVGVAGALLADVVFRLALPAATFLLARFAVATAGSAALLYLWQRLKA